MEAKSRLQVVTGDLTAVEADFLVQQCNCLTVKAHGLSQALARKNPAWNLYAQRTPVCTQNLATPETRGHPGTTVLLDDKVVCLLAQWRPGRVGVKYWHAYPESDPPESAEMRLQWFQSCLDGLTQAVANELERRTLSGATTDPTPGSGLVVAFPWRIGCGLAGGDWSKYRAELERWAALQPPQVTSLLVKLPGTQ